MRIQRVYVDTSVLGGCFDSEFAEWSNALVTDFRHGRFTPLLSEVTAAEVASAPGNVQRTYTDLLSLPGHEYIVLTAEGVELADTYRGHGILPDRFTDDMVHVALATVAGADILVSWNFRHIVHFDKIRAFNAVNLEQGYRGLDIFSPREVATHGSPD